jgi:hypothetical protein
MKKESNPEFLPDMEVVYNTPDGVLLARIIFIHQGIAHITWTESGIRKWDEVPIKKLRRYVSKGF